jgi:ribonuclease VapC
VIIAVDASALVAIALGEPEALAIDACLQAASAAYIAPVNVVEAGLALVLRNGHFTRAQFGEWLEALRLEERDVPGRSALSTYLTYGRGVHPAGLNLGDCFAYALARQLDAPLLYKGRDFIHTDVHSALQPT